MMNWMLRSVGFLSFLMAGGVLAHSQPVVAAPGATPELFPTTGFETQLAFWKQVFTHYGENEVLLHDKNDLRLIYEVVTFPRAPHHSSAERRRQLRELAAKQKQLVRFFDDLIRLGPASPRLSARHQGVLALLGSLGYQPTPSLLRRLKQNIRDQRGIKEKFQEGLVRSGRYLEAIQETLRREGLPIELAFLPHVESSFDYTAYSWKGAAGIWQFTRHTGRRFLAIGRSVDERLDPIRSTEAAARLLKENYQLLGHWPLAITAYNHGQNGMLRAVRVHGPDLRTIIQQHDSRIFGFASKNFYAEFLAAVEVARDHQAYFGPLTFDPPLAFETLRVDRKTTVTRLAKNLNLTEATLREHNPQFTPHFWRHVRVASAGTLIRVPLVGRGAATQMADPAPKPATVPPSSSSGRSYCVRPGDTLSSIARKSGVSIQRLLEANGLRDPNRLSPGQCLVIP